MDEATSALGGRIKAEIQKTLFAMMQVKTVSAIAPGFSTIARMDRIIITGKGTIEESGTHTDLLKK
ncbi:MAG: hypothetical protein P8M25_00810 [Paracoccaceae bacterium]|nr:hypothetical protein [Paracoccaceae bacterium]